MSGRIAYHLPMLAAEPADGSYLGLRTAVAPRLPPLRAMPRRLRAALPLIVCGEDRDGTELGDDSEGDDAAPAWNEANPPAAPTFRIRRWTEAELSAPCCVRVTLTFTRQRHGDAGEC